MDDVLSYFDLRKHARSQRVAATVATTILIMFVLAGCKSDLYSKLSEREANEMIALLIKNGVSTERIVVKDGTSTVRVEETQLATAIELLKANGLPRQSFANMGDVFKSSGLIASPTEERARFIYALSEELSRTISDIDGVLSARIHVVLPKNDLLRQDTTPSSASVFIRHDKEAPLKTLLPHIKMLVANSIEGLSYEKVSVVLVPVDRTATLEAASGRSATSALGSGRDGTVVKSETGFLSIAAACILAIFGIAAGIYWFGRRSYNAISYPAHNDTASATYNSSANSDRYRNTAHPATTNRAA